jgi:hypothetical protein
MHLLPQALRTFLLCGQFSHHGACMSSRALSSRGIARRRAPWEDRHVVCSPTWAHNYSACTLRRDSVLINTPHLNFSSNHTAIPEND